MFVESSSTLLVLTGFPVVQERKQVFNSSDSSNLSFALRKWCSLLHLTATEQKSAVVGKGSFPTKKIGADLRADQKIHVHQMRLLKWPQLLETSETRVSFTKCYHCRCQPLVPFKLATKLSFMTMLPLSRCWIRQSLKLWKRASLASLGPKLEWCAGMATPQISKATLR